MDAEKIGAFIKVLRKEKNLTQKELAGILNCTDKAVSRWETGRGVPEVSFLLPLSDALGVSVNELLMGEKMIYPAFILTIHTNSIDCSLLKVYNI